MIDWIVVLLIVVGSATSLLAAMGALRMPDFYMRLQTSAKASTLGVSCLVLAAAIWLETAGVPTRALLIIAFLFLTAPIAAHMLGRAAYAADIPMWEGGILDELGQVLPAPEDKDGRDEEPDSAAGQD